MGDTEIGATEFASPWRCSPSLSPLAAGESGAGGGDGAPSDWPFLTAPHEADDNQRLQTLAFELTVAEARERQRIAHALHDDLGQLLAMAQFKLSEFSANQARVASEAAPLEEIRQLLCRAAQATRAATFELYSPVLQELGLPAAVEGLAQRLRRDSTMHVHLTSEMDNNLPVGPAVLSVVFRIVRELTLNAQKHASCDNLWISMERDAQGLRISVADDGVGFDAEAARLRFSPDGGFGLISAEAQVQAIGGRLSIESVPGGGTIAAVCLGFDVADSLLSAPAAVSTSAHPASQP